MAKKALSLLLTGSLLLLSACATAQPQVTASTTTLVPESGAQSTSGTQASAASPQGGQSTASSLPEEVPAMQASISYPLPTEIVERMQGISYQEGSPVALEDLAYLRIPYLTFEGETKLGEMVVHHLLAQEIVEIFSELYAAQFPMQQMVLVDEYAADDLLSMAANNSYCFCARLILGTSRYSVHSYGSAIDINPVQNPYITGGVVYPDAANDYLERNSATPGLITEGDACYTAFTSRGWAWGGHWANPDYQHFEKELPAS